MSFVLSDLRTLGVGMPSFAIPIFSKVGSNRSFTHDLDKAGRILRFIEIDDEALPSPYIPELQPLKVDLGEFGIFTIIGNRKIIFQGNIHDLKQHFRESRYDNAVLEIEAAHLLGDKDRLNEAIGNFSWARRASNSAARWASAEDRTFDSLRAIREDSSSANQENLSNLEPEFDRLKAFPETDDWSRVWLSLWQQNYRRDALVKLACWRVDAGYEPQPDGALVYVRTFYGAKDTLYAEKYCLRWFESAPLDVTNWQQLAVALWSRSYLRSMINGILHQKLETELYEGVFAPPVWRRAWKFSWTRSGDVKGLESLAEEYFESLKRVTQPDGEMLLYLLRDSTNIERFFTTVEEWLVDYPRSTLTWADLYLSAYRFHRTGPLLEVGRQWLLAQGGMTNRWKLIWEMLEGDLVREEHTQLGFEWLYRSRNDLRSWTQVYATVAMRVTDRWQKDRLISLGESWLSYRFAWHRDAITMRKMVEYLAD